MSLPLLYQLQGANYAGLSSLDYRVAVVDIDDVQLTTQQLGSLSAQGKTTFTYISIGEAEDYRDYWAAGNWSVNKPSFLLSEDPDWPGCYAVKFWDPAWQSIMLGKVAAAVNAGYSGMYMDLANSSYLDLFDENGSAPVPGFNGTVDQLKQAMVDFICTLSDFAKSLNPDFQVIPQNGYGLLAAAGGDPSVPNTQYLSHIDGFGVEDLWVNDNAASDWTTIALEHIQNVLDAGKYVLATSYPTKAALQQQFIQHAIDAGFIPFVGNRALDGKIAAADLTISDLIAGKNITFPSSGTSTAFLDVQGENLTTGFNHSVTGNVLANDHAANGGAVTLVETTVTTLNGIVITLGADGAFTFTPPANFLGTDRFVYTVSDSEGHTASGMVSVTVAAPAGAVVGTNGDDRLSGPTRGNCTVITLDGNDTVTTGKGVTAIIAGAGNHTFVINNSADSIELTGSPGHDLVKSSVSYTLPGVIEEMVLTGSAKINATGNDAGNKLTGNTGQNTLDGKGGNDKLYGGAGNDKLNGGADDDFLSGGLGHDLLTGGFGADVFAFEGPLNSGNTDTISDFTAGPGGDVLDIHDLLTGFDPLASLVTDFVRMETVGANTVLSVDRDGAGTAFRFQQVATLTNVTGLTDEAALVASHNLLVS